jgi:glucosamine--fructose-6-phosphate aminotransferase (isomerizing)
MAGFTEFDVIRSHQVREGKLTRKEAFDLVQQENKPRFVSIEWYSGAVGIDVNRLITTINAAPKLFPLPGPGMTIPHSKRFL